MADEAKTPVKAKGQRRARVKQEPTAATIFDGARTALASAMKAAGVGDDIIGRETTILAEKCGMDYTSVYYEAPSPYGGAVSFSEVDSYNASAELDEQIATLNDQFQSIVTNVLGSDDLTMIQKSDMVAAAAADLKARVMTSPAAGTVDDEGDDDLMQKEYRVPATGTPRTMVGSTGAKGTSFKAFKEGETWHWFAVYSNTGIDKTKEWFSEAAHKDFVEHVWADPATRMPELWDWHTPVGVATYHDGRKGMGRADFVDFADGLAVASGHFYPEFNYAAEALAGAKELGVSHGYEYDSSWLKPSGEYTAYRSFEISPLPRSRAANELTLFMPELAEKETPMFNPTRRPHLVEIHGEARVKAMEDALAPTAAALKAAGKEVSFKELEDALATNATAAAAPSVPIGNAAAGATPAPGEKEALALASLVVTAVKEGLAPIEARLAALETPVAPRTAEEIALAAIKEAFGPRVTPSPGQAPSESASTVINGNAGAVQAAKAGAKDGAGPEASNLPAHLQPYAKDIFSGVLGAFSAMTPDPDAVVAMASQGA